MANNWNYGDSYFDGNSYKTRAQAFAAARKNNRGVFTYKGKLYNTMQKGENADEFRKTHADYDYFLGNIAKDQGGWKPSDPVQISYTVNKVPDAYTSPSFPNSSKPLSKSSKSSKPQTPERTKLSMFTNDDIRNLGFRNYTGMVSAIGNKANANNNFVKAMINRYGSNTSKWNQNTIENDLSVKGTYRSFGSGDFGDMARSMSSWIGDYNGKLDKIEQDRIDKHNQAILNGVLQSSNKNNTSYNNRLSFIPDFSTKEGRDLALKNINSLSITPKFQQGGTVNMNEQDQIKQFISTLAQGLSKNDPNTINQLKSIMQSQDRDSFIQVIQNMAESGDQDAQFILSALTQSAKRGAKLNYIKQLRGICPEGYEMQYFNTGGTICKKCAQKQKMQEGGDMNPIDEFKCGRKMKKKACGGDIKKDACGSKVNMDKCGGKAKKKKMEMGGPVTEKTDTTKQTKQPLQQKKRFIAKKTTKLDPKTTKTLPNGKYPTYWTSSQRQTWERLYGEGDEGAGTVKNNGVGKN